MATHTEKNILLDTETARELFWEGAQSLPVCCFGKNRVVAPTNVTELIFPTDEKRKTIFRLCGADEACACGKASDYEVFRALCSCAEALAGHPFLLQCQIVLNSLFDCDLLICPDHCDEIWRVTADLLSTKDIYRRLPLSIRCFSDGQGSLSPAELISTDSACLGEGIRKLEAFADREIKDLSCLCSALSRLLDDIEKDKTYADPADLTALTDFTPPNEYEADQALKAVLRGEGADMDQRQKSMLRNQLLRVLGQECQKRGLPLTLLISGADMTSLSKLLHYLEKADALPRTVLLVGDGEEPTALATLCCEFEGINGSSRVSICLTDWATQSPEQLERRIGEFAACFGIGNLMALSCNKHVLTAYCEQEYFKRVFCRWLGRQIEGGLLLGDTALYFRLLYRVFVSNVCQIWDME